MLLCEALTHPSNAALQTGVLSAARALAEAMKLEHSIYTLITLVTADHHTFTYFAGMVREGGTRNDKLAVLAGYERDVTLADIRKDDRRLVGEPQANVGYDHAIVPLYDMDNTHVLVVVAGLSESLCKTFACVLAYSVQAVGHKLMPME